jgi:DNA-binding NtrC family response regulator
MTIIKTYAKTRRKIRHLDKMIKINKRELKLCNKVIKECNEDITRCAKIIGIPVEELERKLKENSITS